MLSEKILLEADFLRWEVLRVSSYERKIAEVLLLISLSISSFTVFLCTHNNQRLICALSRLFLPNFIQKRAICPGKVHLSLK